MATGRQSGGFRAELSKGMALAGDLVRAAQGLVRAGVMPPPEPGRLARMAWRGLWDGGNLATAVAAAAVRHPDRTAIEDEVGAMTYRELDRRVQAMAGALATDCIGPGDTVAIMCRNHRGFVEALLAVSRVGADAVLLNTEFPAPQLQQVLERHKLALVIHDAEFNPVFLKAGHVGRRILADSPMAPESLCALVTRREPPPGPRRQGELIILTSGTTGVPKGAPRKSQPLAFLGPAITLLGTLPLRAGEAVLIGPPLFHAFGLAFLGVALGMGSPVILLRRFDSEQVAQKLVLYQVRTLVAVPVMLQRLLALPAIGRHGYSFHNLSTVISAGAPLTAALAERWMDTHGENLFNLYGSTETGFGTLASPRDLRLAPGTVGRAPVGIRIAILDDQGDPVPPGVSGHIGIRSGLTFDGYVGGGSKPVLNGFMNTGDVGYLDAEGRLFVEGREDDMIVSGGENVFPQEVEELLAAHPAVADVAVVGARDEEFGQRLLAFVVRRPGETVGEEALKDFLRYRIARYKVPRRMVFLTELPRNATGKILRRQLAQWPDG